MRRPSGSRPAPAWRVPADPGRLPLLIFDGDCGFCRRGVERWRARTGDSVEYAASREAAARFPAIPVRAYGESALYVEPGGAVWSGAAAVLHLLALDGRSTGWLRLYDRVPGFAPLAELVYRLVARHRSWLSRLRPDPPSGERRDRPPVE